MQKSLSIFHDGDIRCIYREDRPHSLSETKEIDSAVGIIDSVLDLSRNLLYPFSDNSGLSEVYIDVETISDNEDGALILQIKDEIFRCYPIWTITEGTEEDERIHDAAEEIMKKVSQLLNNYISLADTIINTDASFAVKVY